MNASTSGKYEQLDQIAEEFAEAWIMDLGGDVRANPKISGTKHNAMGI